MPIVGFSGFSGVGKDEAAKTLVEVYGFERRGFADRLKQVLYYLNPRIPQDAHLSCRLQEMVDLDGWDEAKKHPDVRRMLQVLGVEARGLNNGIWVDQVFGAPWDKLVIPDVRFENEVVAILQLGGCIIRIDRPGTKPMFDHVSERIVYADEVILNDGTLAEFRSKVMEVVDPLIEKQET